MGKSCLIAGPLISKMVEGKNKEQRTTVYENFRLAIQTLFATGVDVFYLGTESNLSIADIGYQIIMEMKQHDYDISLYSLKLNTLEAESESPDASGVHEEMEKSTVEKVHLINHCIDTTLLADIFLTAYDGKDKKTRMRMDTAKESGAQVFYLSLDDFGLNRYV